MQKGAKKKMTIDGLAAVIASSFSGLEKRLTRRIDGVESGLRKEIEGVKKDVEEVKKDVEGVKKDVEGVKNQLEGTNKRIDDLAETKVTRVEYRKLEDRVTFLEKHLR